MFKKVGARIRRVRLARDMKQKELARRVGLSQGALTNFELGRRNISLEWLVRIARALDTPVAYFLADVEAPSETSPVDPGERRLLRAYRGLERDPRLQADLIRTIERVARHVGRRGERG